MSKLETNTIDTLSGTNTLQVGDGNVATINLGKSGDTINIPSGATITNSGTANNFGGTNTPAFSAYSSSNISISNATETTIVFGSEYYDSNSAYNASTGKFTPQTAGKYFISYAFTIDSGQSTNLQYTYAYIEKNTTNLHYSSTDFLANPGRATNLNGSLIVDMNGSSDFIQIRLYVYANITGSGFNVQPRAVFSGYKIIE